MSKSHFILGLPLESKGCSCHCYAGAMASRRRGFIQNQNVVDSPLKILTCLPSLGWWRKTAARKDRSFSSSERESETMSSELSLMILEAGASSTKHASILSPLHFAPQLTGRILCMCAQACVPSKFQCPEATTLPPPPLACPCCRSGCHPFKLYKGCSWLLETVLRVTFVLGVCAGSMFIWTNFSLGSVIWDNEGGRYVWKHRAASAAMPWKEERKIQTLPG